MKTVTKRILAALLCVLMLAMAGCNDGKIEDTSNNISESTADSNANNATESSGGETVDMKEIVINGKTLDKFMVVTDTEVNSAGKKLCTAIQKGIGEKVRHCAEDDVYLYPDKPYFHLSTLPLNGVVENLTDTQARFYEKDGNFQIVLGSRKITESTAVDYLVENILTKTKDLTGYNETVELTADATLKAEIEKSEAAAKEILDSKNNYSAKDVQGSGKCYYVSYSTGNDSNDGLSPEKPWKTIDRVNSTSIPNGSVVLFKRGDIWRFNEDAYDNYSKVAFFLPRSNVIYSSYGEGAKPAIYGSMFNAAEVGTWKLTDAPNVWVYDTAYDSRVRDIGNIFFNEGEAYGLKKCTDIVDASGSKFSGNYHDLKNDYEFYFHTSEYKVYLYCSKGNPAEIYDSIEMGVRYNMIRTMDNSNIVLDNFTIKYGASHGISVGGSNIKITNCEIGWIGGGWLRAGARYGNGVEMGKDAKNIVVDNNYLYQIYDTALTHQYDTRGDASNKNTCAIENIKYTNNVIENCFWGVEFYVYLAADKTVSRYMKDITISENSILYSGYGWGYWRSASGQPGAAAIKSWNAEKGTMIAGTVIIENNSFVLSKADVLYSVTEEETEVPIYRNNYMLQYEGHKGPTLAIGKSVAVNQRPLWNETTLASHKYLSGKGNTYYTVK